MNNWYMKDDRDSIFKVELDLEFPSWLDFKDFKNEKTRFDFGIQARLIGPPFLEISINGKRVITEEDLNIYPVMKRLYDLKCIKINCFFPNDEVDEMPYECLVHFFTEYQINRLKELLSVCKFRNQYGFWAGDYNYGL